MADVDGIARATTQGLLGMARTELTELKDRTAAVGEQVLSVFGQIPFKDGMRQQIEAVDGDAPRVSWVGRGSASAGASRRARSVPRRS
ncbi:hypothetical protein ACLBX9_18200 [Methylobacterium sp. A49B]|uniref:Uncharacterized protein n=1 Tax=Methylobacterium mesophilicum SR1.6/6 TaxID=908290 RepID=A0A6B9FMJ1_9HYPH|nr:hypothetical protein [Methylobacterium mesophilicum]QGY03763.1 hypothetical protein MMSR116_19080 [Methylobacterium mesophilicum SR1.6/6]